MAMIARLDRFCRELFLAKWRGGLARETDRMNEELLTMLFLEAYGIPSPGSHFVLDLYPELVENFHRWHRRQGLAEFPEAGVCC